MAINEMDARLISQGAETTAIGSSALVSVAEGAGQPQKNIQLGNFANSMAKAVPQKTKDQVSITGLYAKTTDGKMVELTSESVASVVAEVMKQSSILTDRDDDSNLNDLTSDKWALVGPDNGNKPEGTSNELGFVKTEYIGFYGNSIYTVQTYLGWSTGLHTRIRRGSTWDGWKKY